MRYTELPVRNLETVERELRDTQRLVIALIASAGGVVIVKDSMLASIGDGYSFTKERSAEHCRSSIYRMTAPKP
jgi:hypothetical protein